MTAPGDTIQSHIEMTPDVCGVQPQIEVRRITVAHIAGWHERMGMTADGIAGEFEPTLGDVYAALAYYFDHLEAIDAEIAAEEAWVEGVRRSSRSRIPLRPGD